MSLSTSSPVETVVGANIKASAMDRAPAAPVFVPPTIAISREVGTPDQAVANAVGRRLNWPVCDHVLLEQMAADLHVNVRELEQADERPGNWLAEWAVAMTNEPSVTELVYVHRLKKLLQSLGEIGSCVVVGRGAAHWLPPASTFRVGLVAPLEERIAAVARKHGLTSAAAAQFIERTAAERTAFIRKHFHRDLADPENYDLTVNTACFSADDCAAVICAALRLRFSPHELQSRRPD